MAHGAQLEMPARGGHLQRRLFRRSKGVAMEMHVHQRPKRMALGVLALSLTFLIAATQAQAHGGGWVSRTVDSAGNAAEQTASAVGTTVESAGRATGSAVESAAEATGSAVETAAEATGSALKTAADATGRAANRAIDWTKNVINSIF
jgi:hypothetical protein